MRLKLVQERGGKRQMAQNGEEGEEAGVGSRMGLRIDDIEDARIETRSRIVDIDLESDHGGGTEIGRETDRETDIIPSESDREAMSEEEMTIDIRQHSRGSGVTRQIIISGEAILESGNLITGGEVSIGLCHKDIISSTNSVLIFGMKS